jgi:hypothetical protein
MELQPFPPASDPEVAEREEPPPPSWVAVLRREFALHREHVDRRFEALDARLDRRLSRGELRDAVMRHALTAGLTALAARYPDVAAWLTPLLGVVGGQ